MSGHPLNVRCLSCGQYVPMDDLNVSKDMALCRNCGKTFAFLGLLSPSNQPAMEIDLDRLPGGVWRRETFGGFVIGATTRSAAVGCLIPFFCVWGGFSLAGIYGTQIVKGRFDLLPSLFGLPFLAGSVAMFVAIMMMLFGKVEVSVSNGEGQTFTGFGAIGLTQRFDWNGVGGVEEAVNRWYRNGQPMRAVRLLLPDRVVNFGSILNDQRRYCLAQLLRRELSLRGAAKPSNTFDDYLAP